MARKKTAAALVPQLTFSPQELEEARSAPLDQEIELLRHFIQRVALRTPLPDSPQEAAEVLQALSMAGFTLANLLLTREQLRKSGSAFGHLSKAILANEARLKLEGLIK